MIIFPQYFVNIIINLQYFPMLTSVMLRWDGSVCRLSVCLHRLIIQLDVPSFRLPAVGSRAFPIAGAKAGTAYQTM